MSGDRDRNDGIDLDGLEPLRPPAELRDRTLAAARRALAGRGATEDLWSRILGSRIARAAWATAVAVLVLAHVAVSRPGKAVSGRNELTPSLANATEPEVVDQVRMARIDPRLSLGFEADLEAPQKENGS
jgi:hypothetical protein